MQICQLSLSLEKNSNSTHKENKDVYCVKVDTIFILNNYDCAFEVKIIV